MFKYFIALITLLVLIAGGHYAYKNFKGGQGAPDYKNATYSINGENVTLKEGRFEGESDGASRSVIEYFGNDAKGDLNDDGIPDLAFILNENSAGTGIFYYAVAAFQKPDGTYTGSNAIFLGDRIAPQTTEIRNTILIVNYADRAPNEPMASTPSVGVSKYIIFDGVGLLAIPLPGPISIDGEMVCLPHKDTEGPQTMECAYGLKDDEESYFALSDTDPSYKNVSSVPVNTRVRVDGTFKLQLGSKYQDIGIIEVARVTKL